MLEVERYDEIWRSDGLQKDWVLEIERDGRSREGLKAAIVTPQGKQAIGRRLNNAYCDDYGGGTGGDAIGNPGEKRGERSGI